MIDRVLCDDTPGCDGRGCNILCTIYVYMYMRKGDVEYISGV